MKRHLLISTAAGLFLTSALALASPVVAERSAVRATTYRIDYMPTLVRNETLAGREQREVRAQQAKNNGGAIPIHFVSPKSTNPNDADKLATGAGPVQVNTKIYLVFYGAQWSADPNHLKPYLQSFYNGLYGTQDTWSRSLTQYCQNVPFGTTSCAKVGQHIVHPTSSPLAGVWYYTGVDAPSAPTQTGLQNVAIRAAAHFNVKTPAGNANAQYVIATSHNHNQAGFGSQWCAWHSAVDSSYGTIAFTNLPYMPDAGYACGSGFVNSPGTNDGVSIIAGHEYAESVSDPYGSAWTDKNYDENGDKCAWLSPGAPGGVINLTLSTGTFPVQSLFSNSYTATGGCVNYFYGTTQHG